ncbi:MAG TPA: MFS transporter [Lachnospiraceae bacterium]|nr:MFS transporter [Lachnospiraceae bacterium]HBH69980.1 MFS transporter [Lachnospiraceae bacterium]
MKQSLTSLEKKWILYDVANSAFTMMVSTIIPIYFHALGDAAGVSPTDYLAYWGYALSIATLLTAILGPLIGAAGDRGRRKKMYFAASIVLGAAFCMALGFVRQWQLFLVIFCVAKTIYSLSLVIYDSTLADVTTDERMDDVSSAGYAFGYIGSCIPFIACLVLVLMSGKIGLSPMNAMSISLFITAVWWLLVSAPILKVYEQKNYLQDEKEQSVNIGSQLLRSLKGIAGDKKVWTFLLAFFFYIDGVYTIIDMSTAYGSSLGLDSSAMLLALLVTQFVAFPSALLIGRLSRRYKSSTLITICISAYFCIAVFAFFLAHTWQFWVLAVFVGMFQGGIQALSRSYFARITPPERSGEYFGFFDICGKGASIIGTTMMGIVTQATGRQNFGVGGLALFFLIGLVLFRISAKEAGKS